MKMLIAAALIPAALVIGTSLIISLLRGLIDRCRSEGKNDRDL